MFSKIRLMSFCVMFMWVSFVLTTPIDTNQYMIASPYYQTLNGTLSLNGELGSSFAYYFLDLPANAFDFSLTVTLLEQPDTSGTIQAMVRRSAPILATNSPADLATCNQSALYPAALQDYACFGLSLQSSPSALAVRQTRIPQPAQGRYFLTLEAVSGTVQFRATLNFQKCDSAQNAAPESDGTCVPVLPIDARLNSGFVNPNNFRYFYISPAHQSATSAANLLALSVNFTNLDCSDGLVYLRAGAMPDLLDDSPQDVLVIPCGQRQFLASWLYPPTAQVFFLGLSGGNNGVEYEFAITPQFGQSLCKNYKTTGVQCASTLADGALCPFPQVSSCGSALQVLSQAASQVANVPLSAHSGWAFFSVKASDKLFALTVQVSSTVDEKNTLVSGESWELIAHFDTSPNVLLEESQLRAYYPYSASQTLALPLSYKEPLLKLAIPYPAEGTWYFALRRTIPVSFGQPDSTKDQTVASVSIQQQTCPNGCSSHGTCAASTHTCTCSVNYHSVDCSIYNNTRALGFDGNGLVVGLGFSMPVIFIFIILTIAYIWWKETLTPRNEDNNNIFY